jgi:hypothetical protein
MGSRPPQTAVHRRRRRRRPPPPSVAVCRPQPPPSVRVRVDRCTDEGNPNQRFLGAAVHRSRRCGGGGKYRPPGGLPQEIANKREKKRPEKCEIDNFHTFPKKNGSSRKTGSSGGKKKFFHNISRTHWPQHGAVRLERRAGRAARLGM